MESRAALDSDSCWGLWDTEPSWEQRVGLQGAQRTCRHSGFADWWKQKRSFSGELCRCQSGFHHFLCCKTLTLIALRLISTVPTPPENLATWLYYCNVRTVSGPIQAILSSKDMEVRPERDSLAPDLGACELLDRCFLAVIPHSRSKVRRHTWAVDFVFSV